MASKKVPALDLRPDSVIDWLLEEENPSVRLFTLTRLLGEAPEGQSAVKGAPSKWITARALYVLGALVPV